MVASASSQAVAELVGNGSCLCTYDDGILLRCVACMRVQPSDDRVVITWPSVVAWLMVAAVAAWFLSGCVRHDASTSVARSHDLEPLAMIVLCYVWGWILFARWLYVEARERGASKVKAWRYTLAYPLWLLVRLG